MTNTRVLVTGATGKIGGAVVDQLLARGIATRALVHRDDARSARLRAKGAQVVVVDMFDIQQVQSAMNQVDRLYFNPPYNWSSPLSARVRAGNLGSRRPNESRP
jgi:NAD(P)H dehydrogenase (quinone)